MNCYTYFCLQPLCINYFYLREIQGIKMLRIIKIRTLIELFAARFDIVTVITK